VGKYEGKVPEEELDTDGNARTGFSWLTIVTTGRASANRVTEIQVT
jgi:hypothetical protein